MDRRNCSQKDTSAAALAADRALLSTATAEAGAIAKRYFRRDAERWHKGPGQIVTEADIAIDRRLHELLIGARPDDGWLSEERADDGSRLQRRRVWIVDPIDGTRSFAEGVAEFTISIALAIDGEPALGSVYNPITEERFEAAAGGGAFLNGRRIAPSSQATIEGAALLASKGELKKRRWPEALPGGGFTVIGSLAYKLALVAAGRFAGLISLRPSHDWDLAAAMLLLKEAGAWLGDGEGRPIRLDQPTPSRLGLVAAGTEALYSALVSRLETIKSS